MVLSSAQSPVALASGCVVGFLDSFPWRFDSEWFPNRKLWGLQQIYKRFEGGSSSGLEKDDEAPDAFLVQVQFQRGSIWIIKRYIDLGKFRQRFRKGFYRDMKVLGGLEQFRKIITIFF